MKDIRGQEVSGLKSKKTLFVVQGIDINISDKKNMADKIQKYISKRFEDNFHLYSVKESWEISFVYLSFIFFCPES